MAPRKRDDVMGEALTDRSEEKSGQKSNSCDGAFYSVGWRSSKPWPISFGSHLRVTSFGCAGLVECAGKLAENGREKKTLELKCEATFVAFENGAGAAGTARQIQNPSGQLTINIWRLTRGLWREWSIVPCSDEQ
jgi:hypothetical protein